MNKRKLYNILLFGLILSVIQVNLFSQTVRAAADRNRIFIGEQIKLKLSAERGKAGITWFSLPDSINHFEVVKKGKIDTVLNGNYTNYSQIILITSFDSGRWSFPSLSLPGVKQATLPVTIDVLPVDVSKMEDYNDIKDIEEVKQGNNWFITCIIAVITLLCIAALYWLLRKKKKSVQPEASIKGRLSPLEWAMSELNKLNGRNLSAPVEVKRYYSDLANISRTFFNMQLQQRSMYQTTDEWMLSLQPLSVDSDTKTAFFQFLRQADAVKFAKYLPPSQENEISVDAIKRMLQKASLLDPTLYSTYQPK